MVDHPVQGVYNLRLLIGIELIQMGVNGTIFSDKGTEVILNLIHI